MAAALRRSVLAATLVAAGLTACVDGGSAAPTPTPDVTVSDATSTARPAPDPSRTPPAGGATINPPDLSDVVIDCSDVEAPCTYGDDPALDRMWDACADGDGAACDRLYYDSGFDTRYEQFGNTCGDRGLLVPCPDDLE